jgi:hypothetical protein
MGYAVVSPYPNSSKNNSTFSLSKIALLQCLIILKISASYVAISWAACADDIASGLALPKGRCPYLNPRDCRNLFCEDLAFVISED